LLLMTLRKTSASGALSLQQAMTTRASNRYGSRPTYQKSC
jgi:hypothetical protein